MTSATVDDALVYLRDKFVSAKTPEELIAMAGELWSFRHCFSVWDYARPIYRDQMKALWPDHSKQTIVAVDLSAILHSSWAVKGADKDLPITMLKNIYKATSPTHFILALDSPSPRKGLSEEFKADREPKPQEFFDMCNSVIEYMQGKGIQTEKHDNFESDDIMASIALRCQAVECECILVTEDKDMWQCLEGKTAIYSPRAKEFRNAQWLYSKYAIKPIQAIDWVSLVGGKNNVAGCPLIGETKASALLKAHGDIHGIYYHRDSLTPKLKESFEKFYKEDYWKIKEIHTLNRACPVSWSPRKDSPSQ